MCTLYKPRYKTGGCKLQRNQPPNIQLDFNLTHTHLFPHNTSHSLGIFFLTSQAIVQEYFFLIHWPQFRNIFPSTQAIVLEYFSYHTSLSLGICSLLRRPQFRNIFPSTQLTSHSLGIFFLPHKPQFRSFFFSKQVIVWEYFFCYTGHSL